MRFKKILKFFSDKLFKFLAKKYKTDYKVQKLTSQKVFYLILYTHFLHKFVSLRSLAQDFNDKHLQKKLFNNERYQTIHHSSVHYRLSNINPEYYKFLYKVACKKACHFFHKKKDKKTKS